MEISTVNPFYPIDEYWLLVFIRIIAYLPTLRRVCKSWNEVIKSRILDSKIQEFIRCKRVPSEIVNYRKVDLTELYTIRVPGGSKVSIVSGKDIIRLGVFQELLPTLRSIRGSWRNIRKSMNPENLRKLRHYTLLREWVWDIMNYPHHVAFTEAAIEPHRTTGIHRTPRNWTRYLRSAKLRVIDNVMRSFTVDRNILRVLQSRAKYAMDECVAAKDLMGILTLLESGLVDGYRHIYEVCRMDLKEKNTAILNVCNLTGFIEQVRAERNPKDLRKDLVTFLKSCMSIKHNWELLDKVCGMFNLEKKHLSLLCKYNEWEIPRYGEIPIELYWFYEGSAPIELLESLCEDEDVAVNCNIFRERFPNLHKALCKCGKVQESPGASIEDTMLALGFKPI